MVRLEELWNGKMETGIALIDNHHRTLLGLLVDLRNAFDSGFDHEFVLSLTDALKSYTKYHFMAEERFMLERKYPLIGLHRAEHAKFVAAVDDFESSLGRATTVRMRELHEFLKAWLVDHILVKDKDFAAFHGAGTSDGSGGRDRQGG